MLFLMIIAVIVLMLIDVPVAFALAITSAIFFIVEEVPLASYVQMATKGVDSYTLLALPFFILTGKLMNASGATDRIMELGKAIVGWMYGGLGHANIMASFLFAGISGSAVADAGGLGAVEVKAMEKAGYSKRFAIGVTAASATVGPIIPPSIIMIVYGIASGTSIGALFLGGIVPGILMAVAMMGLVSFLARREHKVERIPFRLANVRTALWHALPALITPFLIVMGILTGVFTATESGAVAAFYALIVALVSKQGLSLVSSWKLIVETVVESAGILLIMAMASVFSWTLAYQQAPQTAVSVLTELTSNPMALLLLLGILYLILGCFIEAIAIVTMTIPVVIPILQNFGIDPVHFGVVLALIMSIGTITPPLGIVMFTLCRVTKVSVPMFASLIMPWLALLIGVVALVMSFPELVLFIPKLAGAY
ncbi:TRAP transporter large permease [Marinomonas pollencensis]|uniref:TRAP transporter large permease protein n=1 Tax=Marinomonas pollencensis TaxID=491954 RepID=A0A3E0DT15_9GAMM|nr:TRAP transporter large permease [Marinomonas pollencensis]REG85636.1 tripartite ATP-independent transporter DctM subunit [Marinomonas pollencensis]